MAAEIDNQTGEPHTKFGFLYLNANRRCDGFERQKAAKYKAKEGSQKARAY